jgi:branched-chain amino acid transport system substrate-binding protein
MYGLTRVCSQRRGNGHGHSWRLLLALAAATLLVAASCSSSSNSSSGNGHTYTVGVLADLTGPAATNTLTMPIGVKAGVGLAATKGYTIKYDVADTTSSPTGALTAAQRLVDQDHVFAVLAYSALTFSASDFLASQGVPVIGAAVDGNEWITQRNMFSILGTEDYTKVTTTLGLIMKHLGATNMGSIGYSISPSSTEVAKGSAISAQAAGIKVGYLNANFPFGSTNVGPIAIAMKNANIDSLTGSIETNTEFALINALRQEGVNLKVAVLPTGYGGDLTSGGPGAQQTGQGLYFLSGYEPVEMNTPATQLFVHSLRTYAGVTGLPTFAEYIGYVSVDGLVTGLKAAGSKPTQASLINAMLGISNYNAVGLFGSHSITWVLGQRGKAQGADNCEWITQYSGTTFHVIPGLAPVCGTVIPGKTVSSSS